jgi:hypothetical protein
MMSQRSPLVLVVYWDIAYSMLETHMRRNCSTLQQKLSPQDTEDTDDFH